ncbi:hypothetical protein [Fulvivirga imtechensis]|nr:hypothetical protein [Fulvivirga imtechensis]
MAAFAIMFAAVISTNATIDVKNDVVTVNVDPTKTEITPSQLPADVKDAIMDGDYAQWNIEKAYKITYTPEDGDEAKVEYEVHFSNDQGQKEIEVYDEEGELIED